MFGLFAIHAWAAWHAFSGERLLILDLASLMRVTHFTVIVCIAAFAHSGFAADRCQQISDVVAQAAAMKPKLAEQLKKDPQKGTLGEPWRWFAFTLGSDLDKL